MNKHYVLKRKKRFYSFLITLSIILLTTLYATAAYGNEQVRYDIIRVKKGDTLWSIVHNNYKNIDIRKCIYEIKKANDLKSSDIYEGELLKLPT